MNGALLCPDLKLTRRPRVVCLKTMNGAQAPAEVLIVEDEVLWRRHLVSALESEGYAATGVGSLEEADRTLGGLSFDWVLLDVNLPDGSGLEWLRERKPQAAMGVIVMTAEGGVAAAVEAMRLGAVDFLSKPFEAEELSLVFARTAGRRRSERVRKHERSGPGRNETDFYFGPHHVELRERLEKILVADERLRERPPPLLLWGETGTGKSALARWVHAHGPRADGPFVEVNCAALPENLVESELFGYEKGAFTDARTDRLGLFEAATGGTLFLDEIGSLPLAQQAKILTAVEQSSIRRVGGRQARPIDCRLIAATLEDLPAAVREGRFREDLYHRLSLLELVLPPLRSDPEAAVQTAQFLLKGLFKRYRLPSVALRPAVLDALRTHPWPGNVRELRHELERALIYSEPGSLELSMRAPAAAKSDTEDLRNPNWVMPTEGFALEAELGALEQTLIDEALREAGGNVSAAARRLGVARDYLRYRIRSVDAESE